jgi:hypothetical protein
VRSGFFAGETFESKPVTYSVVEEKDPDTEEAIRLAAYEGDIVLGTEDEMAALAADVRGQADAADEGDAIAHGIGITGRRYRWPSGVVPYEIHSSLPNQSRVTQAIAHWQQHTRIRFVRRTSGNASRYPNYVRFIPASGCWSYVGMRTGKQDLGLAGGCTTGNTIHEIGHAVGLWHEQSREDRNRFVRINYANIISGYEHNFNQHITDGDDYGPYDYGSIMHYPAMAFSRNGRPTIEPLRSGVTIGQRSSLSRGDIAAVRAMYPNLEPRRTWLGVQFRGTVPAGQTKTWFTHSWPAHWHVDWTVVPISPPRDAGPQIEWKVQVTRQNDNVGGFGALNKYFIRIRNVANYSVRIEARYHVLGWLR